MHLSMYFTFWQLKLCLIASCWSKLSPFTKLLSFASLKVFFTWLNGSSIALYSGE